MVEPASAFPSDGHPMDRYAKDAVLIDEVVVDARAGEDDNALGDEGEMFAIVEEWGRATMCDCARDVGYRPWAGYGDRKTPPSPR